MAERLTKSFFQDELKGLAEGYAAETGATKVLTELLLRDGVTLRMERTPTYTDTYLIVDFKNGNQARRAVVPYGSIQAVSFVGENAGGLGFHR